MQHTSHRLTRRHLLRWAGASIALLAASCGAPPVPTTGRAQPTSPPTEQAAPARERLWVLQKRDFFPAFNGWFQQEIARWCEAQGWPLDIAYAEEWAQGMPFVEKLTASVAAGSPPDLVMHSLGISELRRVNGLAQVSHIVEQVEGQWGQASKRMELDYRAEGEWWAVPYFQRSDGGWFRRPAFEEQGIDLRKVRQYTDLAEACLAASKPDAGLYGWGVTIARCGDGDWFRIRVMHGWGAYIQDETGRYVTVDTPEMIEAMTWMTNLYLDERWARMMPPNVLAWNDNSNNEAYLAGQIAYTQNGGTIYAQAVVNNNPIKDMTGYHAPCGGPVNAEFNSLSANSLMILTGAQNREAAEDAILYLTMSLETMDAVFRNAPAYALPCYHALWDKSEFIPTDPVAMEQKSVALDPEAIVPGVWPGPTSDAWTAANNSGAQQEMVQSILHGTPVKEAVRACHERYVQIWKEHGLPGE